MKRIIVCIIALVMISSFAYADDYSKLSNDELLAEINHLRNELLTRELTINDNYIFYDNAGIKLYVDGPFRGEYKKNYKDEYRVYYEFDVILINDSDNEISINVVDTYINGWQSSCSASLGCKAGKKARGKMTFSSAELKEGDAETGPEEIEFTFHFYDPNTLRNVTKDTTVTVTFPMK